MIGPAADLIQLHRIGHPQALFAANHPWRRRSTPRYLPKNLPTEDNPIGPSKLVDVDQIVAIRRQARQAGRSVVWTNGCFDLLHLGHVRNLQAAKNLGDVLIVGLNSDASVRQLKGLRRPIIPQAERAEILAALACVDYVVIFEDVSPVNLLRRIQPDIHCKGAEYRPPHGKPIPELDVIQSSGGRVEFIPLVDGISTTDVVQRILDLAGKSEV